MEHTVIWIKYKGWFDNEQHYMRCYNISFEYKEDIIIIHFDQKQLFGKTMIHRDIVLVKSELKFIRTRTRITEIPHKVIEQ